MSLFDRIGRDSIYYLGSTVALSVASIVSLPVFTRQLGPEAYGYFDLILVISLLANKVICVEITQSVGVFQSEARGHTASAEVAQTAFSFTVLALAVAVGAGATLSGRLSLMMFGSPDRHLEVWVSLAYLFFFGVHYFFLNQFRWSLRPFSYLKVSSLQSLGMLGCALAAYRLEAINLPALIGLLSAVLLLCSIFSAVMLRDLVRFRLRVSLLSKMLIFSVPLMLNSSLYWFNSFVDRILVSKLLDAISLGNYAAAAKLAGFVILFSGVLHASLTPIIVARSNEAITKSDLGEIFQVYVIFFILVYLVYLGFNREFVGLIFGPQYSLAVDVLPILLLSVFVGSLYPFFPGAVLEKKTSLLLLSSGVGVTSNIALNLLFIPIWGLKGAAFSTLIGSICSFSLYFFISQKLYQVKLNAFILAAWVAASLVPLGLSIYLETTLGPLFFAAYAVVLCIAAFYFRLITVEILCKFFAVTLVIPPKK